MKEMDKRLIAPLILCAVSPLGYAAQNCEATAGIAAGAADYLYETAQVKQPPDYTSTPHQMLNVSSLLSPSTAIR